MISVVIIALLILNVSSERDCEPSLTTISGSARPGGIICPGDLVFEDNFDSIDLGKWQQENTLSGGWVRTLF